MQNQRGKGSLIGMKHNQNPEEIAARKLNLFAADSETLVQTTDFELDGNGNFDVSTYLFQKFTNLA